MKSANHHYVPQGILKKFCFSNEQLFYFSRNQQAKGVQVRNTKSVFKRRHLNSWIDESGNRRDSLERFFATNFDDPIVEFAVKCETAVATNTVNQIGDDDHRFFVQFLYNYIKRTPDIHELALEKSFSDGALNKVIDKFEDEYRELTADEKLQFHEKVGKKDYFQNARIHALSDQNPDILDMMATKNLLIGIPANNKKQFITASSPVARFQNVKGDTLKSGTFETWTTLSPRLVVGLMGKKTIPSLHKFPDSAVRKLNRQLARQSVAIGGSSKELIKSMVTSMK